MKRLLHLATIPFALLAPGPIAFAHIIGDPEHDEAALYDASVQPPTNVVLGATDGAQTDAVNRVAFIAASFQPFAPKVSTHADDQFFYVESDGMPDHRMMVGITAWQQQVPWPQSYTGGNAWRFPLWPVEAANPLSAKTHFFRGAIAIAANGVPIFNPIKNDGVTDTLLAGELDEFGGHAGRADDYHYHIAPLHLQTLVGTDHPVAFALDGYPIYGLTEPDGTPVEQLDAFNGHTTPEFGYHYHATKTYPYLNGGFHGEVVERDGQVDPQPLAQGPRPATEPLRGAKITDFTQPASNQYSLTYQVGGETRQLNYQLQPDGTALFEIVDGQGRAVTNTYEPQQQSSGADNAPALRGDAPPPARTEPGRNEGRATTPPLILTPIQTGNLVLHSSVVAAGGALPVEFTGDGTGISPPIEWSGAPAGTKSFAIVMDHLAPGNDMKCYWTLWDIPAEVTSLPKNSKAIGKLGPGFNGGLGYEPPHSKGPGLKTYTIHIYALSAPPKLKKPQREVTREVLLTAIQDLILDSAELKVTYTRPAGASDKEPDGSERGKRPPNSSQ
jgi:phosphatidylethanolamine-binding protein (PEBP) family uncharacterized protein